MLRGGYDKLRGERTKAANDGIAGTSQQHVERAEVYKLRGKGARAKGEIGFMRGRLVGDGGAVYSLRKMAIVTRQDRDAALSTTAKREEAAAKARGLEGKRLACRVSIAVVGLGRE